MADGQLAPPRDKITAPKRIGEGKAGPGRPKGAQNKTTALLKDAILEAATKEGGKEGLVGYLRKLATSNETAFASLLGRAMPLQLNHGDNDGGKLQPTINFTRGVGPAE